ncbi:MAG: hypothetical protein QOF78_419 [Phycisphaerales bacterium]|nr:hypothetical protein [Phycisphaerales bacterium]
MTRVMNSSPLRVAVYVFDVGSIRQNNFGWVRANINRSDDILVVGGRDIDDLIVSLRHDAEQGLPLALGGESPQFIGVPQDQSLLGSGREGEGDRSCFAPAGGYVATLGVQQMAFVLAGLRGIARRSELDWTRWDPQDANVILLFEAFVSGRCHDVDNDAMRDAATAAVRFLQMAQGSALLTDVRPRAGTTALSLIGAVALWSGLATDAAVLFEPVLVVKPAEPYCGPIEPYDSR